MKKQVFDSHALLFNALSVLRLKSSTLMFMLVNNANGDIKMKKTLFPFVAVLLIVSLVACTAKKQDWSAVGYFGDEDGNLVSLTWMDDIDEPGWYVGLLLGEDLIEDSWGGTLPRKGNSLRGTLSTLGSKAPLDVTLTAEETGLKLETGGRTFHLTPVETPVATIVVTINTEGSGNIDWTEGANAPEIDPEHPYQSAYIGLAEPAVHTFLAWPREGWKFVKWTKNGEDYSTDAQITVLLDVSADFVAEFSNL